MGKIVSSSVLLLAGAFLISCGELDDLNRSASTEVSATYDSVEDFPECKRSIYGKEVRLAKNDYVYICSELVKEWLYEVESVDDLPRCTSKRQGGLVYVLDEDVIKVCDGVWEDYPSDSDDDFDPVTIVKSSSSRNNSNLFDDDEEQADEKSSSSSRDDLDQDNEDSEKEKTFNSYTDSRDGQTYKTVVINGKEWFAENLKYDVDYLNWCAQGDCDSYGYLYSRTTVSCPSGWELPNSEDWLNLLTKVGAINLISEADGGTNKYGFNVELLGLYDWNYGESGYGRTAYFWADDFEGGYGRYVTISKDGDYSIDYVGGSNAIAARCVRDAAENVDIPVQRSSSSSNQSTAEEDVSSSSKQSIVEEPEVDGLQAVVLDAQTQPPVVGISLTGTYKEADKKGLVICSVESACDLESAIDNEFYGEFDGLVSYVGFHNPQNNTKTMKFSMEKFTYSQGYVRVVGLNGSSTYYIRPYVEIDGNITYGETVNFETISFSRSSSTLDYANVWEYTSYGVFDIATDEYILGTYYFVSNENTNKRTTCGQVGCYKTRTDMGYHYWLQMGYGNGVKVAVVPPKFVYSNGKIAVTTNEESATIYYTVNGDAFEPDAWISEYDAPIPVSAGDVVHAYVKTSKGYVSTPNSFIVK